MNGTAQQAPAGTSGAVFGDGLTAGSVLRARLTKARLWLVLAALLAVTVVLVSLAGGQGGRGLLSPVNPAPDGAKAVVEVLRDHGVTVSVATGLPDVLDMVAAEPDAYLFFHDPFERLNEEQLRLLAGAEARRVLIQPSLPQLRILAPGIRSAGLVPDGGSPLTAHCDEPAARTAGGISRGGQGYRGPVSCFPVSPEELPADTAAAAGPAGSLATDDGDVTVLGNPEVLTNGAITEEGNAALALGLLGQEPVLIWYQPSVSDIATGTADVDPASLLPAWVGPGLVWLLIVGVLAALWRGRRLGALVTEPLPVVVPAAETAEGRARLYQSSRAIGRAAENLRAATLVRLAARLRLGPGATAAAVIDGVAAHTGRTAADLGVLFDHRRIGTDHALVRWAQELARLETSLEEGTIPR